MEAMTTYTEDDWYGWIDPNIKKNIMYSGHLLQNGGPAPKLIRRQSLRGTGLSHISLRTG